MAKNTIIIDLDKWTTQTNKAANTIGKQSGLPVSVEYISKLIRLNKLKSLPLPQIGIVLVEK
jgi:transcriptional antiterminator Rof (Rho-off)